MNTKKVISVFLAGILLTAAFGVVQADNGNEKGKDGTMHPQKAVFEVEQMTIHNWSFYVGPDDTPDRTVYVDPISIADKTYQINAQQLMKKGGMSDIATMPAKNQAKAQAKADIDRKKGETVRVCIKSIEVKNVKVVAKLPEKMPHDMQSASSEQQSTMAEDSQLPSYQITVHRMNIKKWSFVVGSDDTPDETITLGDISLEDRTIPLGASAMEDKQSMAAMQSVRDQVKKGMMKKGAKMGTTYRVIIQNIHLHDVKFVAGNSDAMNETTETESTTQTTTTDQMTTTTTDQGMTTTTADTSSDSDSGGEETKSTESSGQPGFGISVAVIACLGAALLATRTN